MARMNTKLLMMVSAVAMGMAGTVLTFLPQELLQHIQMPVAEPMVYILQLAGALYLSFAMLNWMAKNVLIGGIYSRPLAMANFLHFTMGALMFIKALAGAPASLSLWLSGGVYSSFALLFGLVMFRHPFKQKKSLTF